MTGSHDRIVTVSMVSDTLPNVRFWVDRTLRTGVDHMLVFLDDHRPDVQAWLEQHPMVSVVHTDAAYWNHDRPTPLPDRQMVNANLSLAALAKVPSAGWLFHIDVDEALSFDRETFLELDPRAARFPTLEAVAKRRWRGGEPKYFKKQPRPEDLYALAGLGAIARPDLDAYFRGHHLGKTGVRPSPDVRFRVHSVYEHPDTKIETIIPPDMHLLHYASWCLDDFVDRWRDFRPEDAAGRPFRSKNIGTAFYTLRNHPAMSQAQRDEAVGELFDRNISDDIPLLRDFGLLVDNPLRLDQPARPMPREDVALLETRLKELLHVDKTPYKSQLLQVGRRTDGSR
ncbi:MAG: glycosyltransferase family 2 protein [Nocardioidaceae bacterium]|nr:glycosyltransferase family 2 protein [Nocardioidaceae bacterium]